MYQKYRGDVLRSEVAAAARWQPENGGSGGGIQSAERSYSGIMGGGNAASSGCGSSNDASGSSSGLSGCGIIKAVERSCSMGSNSGMDNSGDDNVINGSCMISGGVDNNSGGSGATYIYHRSSSGGVTSSRGSSCGGSSHSHTRTCGSGSGDADVRDWALVKRAVAEVFEKHMEAVAVFEKVLVSVSGPACWGLSHLHVLFTHTQGGGCPML